jgi:hypothetical protein
LKEVKFHHFHLNVVSVNLLLPSSAKPKLDGLALVPVNPEDLYQIVEGYVDLSKSRCGSQFLEGFPQIKHCFKPHLAFYNYLLHL